MHLRVVQAFGGHTVGDVITAPDDVEAILASEQTNFAVAVPEPAEPAPTISKE